MTTINDFIFIPGIWLGEGKITFNTSNDHIKFYVKWEITEDDDTLKATQTIEMNGVEEHVINHFVFSEIKPTSFLVTLESEAIGLVKGKGLRNERLIAWEFPIEEGLQGFEVYEKQNNGDFSFHAEYGGPNDFLSLVEGLLWKKQ